MIGETLELDSVSKIDEFLGKPMKYRKIANRLLETRSDLINTKVKLLGGYTSDVTLDWLFRFSAGFGMKLDIEKSPWGPAYALSASMNHANEDASVLLCLNHAFDLQLAAESVTSSAVIDEVVTAWSSLVECASQSSKQVIATYYEDDSFLRPGLISGKVSSHDIYRINYELSELAIRYPCLNLVSMKSLTAILGHDNNDNWRDWYAFGQPISNEASLLLGHHCANLIANTMGKSKKVLVLDLDNTLWSGIIGDDGVEGIEVGGETYDSRIHMEFQLYAKGLLARGVMLAIASKNEEVIAKSAFAHPGMILQWTDFSCIEINWDRKSESLKRIASKLNVGLDSLVFLDDNPAEREEVKGALPMVLVPDVKNPPIDFLKFLHLRDPFGIEMKLTSEDKLRSASFAAEQIRTEFQDSSSNYEEFLAGLKTRLVMYRVNDRHVDRYCQLTNKTNQFNLTTLRLERDEVMERLNDDGYLLIAANVRDKFGDYGMTSLMSLKLIDDVAIIENWVMSCRIFGKTVEHAFMSSVLPLLSKNGINILKGVYIPTKKNKVIMDLLPNLGFSETDGFSSNDSKKFFEIDLNQAVNTHHYCEVLNEL